MPDRIAVSFKNLSPRIVGADGATRPTRVQRFEVRGNFPTRDIQEHGNNQLAGIVYDIPDYTVVFSVLDTSIKVYAALTGTDPDSYPAEGVDINEFDVVDFAADFKSETIMDYVKALYVRKARVQSFRFSYNVDGDSTEEYTFGASTRQLFKHDVIVDTLDASSSPATLTETPEVLKNGNYAISVMVDGVRLEETTGTSPDSGYYSISGTTIYFGTTGTDLVVSYMASPAGTNWSWNRDTTIPVAIPGKNVPITIAASGGDVSLSRVQTVNINANLRSDPVRELGNAEIVGYTYQIPEITGDLTVLDTDAELMALFSTGDETNTDNEYRSCELLTGYNMDLLVKLRDPADPCALSGTVLKTVKIPNIQLTGESYTSNVGENVGLTLNWRSADGNLVVYSGEPA